MLVLLHAFPSPAPADGIGWTVSPVLGVHRPELRALNQGEFRAPLPGRGRLIPDAEGSGENFDFVIDNPLPELSSGAEAGLEIGLVLDERNTFFFGASVWEDGSASAVRTEMPFQGTMTRVGYERTGRVSYFQYFLGWQRTLLSEARRYRLYGRVALHEMFDIDYREELVFGFDAGAETFKRIIVMESQATGLLAAQLGIGGEYFLASWLSIGGDLGYTKSLRRFELGSASLSTDIQAEDNLNFRTPAQVNAQGRLTYLAEAASYSDATYRAMVLGFDGWRAALRVNLHF